MKRAMWTAILLALGAVTAPTQQSGKTVPAPGPAPTSSLVWIAQRGANQVMLRTPANPSVFVTTLAGAAYGFAQPWDIVHLPSRTLVFVTNAGNGTVTVINSDTTKAVAIVDLAGLFNGRNLGGMSVSAGEDAVFIAGADLNGAAIFRINVPSLTASRIGGKAGPPADDCAAVRGSGNTTRKVYFTQRLTDELSEINLAAGGAVSTVTLGVGTLNEVHLPDNMDRTADHRFVFVGCTKIFPAGNLAARTVRINPQIEPLSAAVTQPAIMNGGADLDHVASDISWGTGPGGINRGFVLLSLDNGIPGLVEIDETGARVGVGIPPSGGAGGVTPSTLRFMSSSEQIFVGEVPGTSNQYNVFNAKFGSGIVLQNTVPSGATEPGHFALVPMAQPVITDMCPRGELAAPSNIVTIYGAGFLPGASYGGAAAIPVGFIDSNTVTVDLGGAPPANLGITITNPNTLSATIDLFFRRYTPEVPGSFPITFPPAGGGYAMYSIPQYCSLTAFKAALVAQFGPYNPVLYRVFFYRNGRYVELNTMTDDGCDLAGEAFWMVTRSGGTVTFAEPDVRANAGGFSRVIPINPGFNMISVPMTGGTPPAGQITWASVLVTDDQTNFGTAQSTGSIFGLGILAPAALEFVGGSYVTADPLITGRGYWVENITTRPAYLVFATTAVNKPGPPAGTAGGPPPPGMKPPPPPSGISEGGSSGVCGFTGVEILLALLAVRGFHRSRRLRKLVA